MLITCPKCGKNFSDTLNACPHCGELMSKYKKCRECGRFNLTTSATCFNCGFDFVKAQQAAEKERLSRKCEYCSRYDLGTRHCGIYNFQRNPTKCKHYSYDEFNHELSKKPCYLTTACVEYYGKNDDCYELQTLRNFRDNILRKTPKGQKLCDEYYKIAPPIVDRLHELNDSANYEYIYAQILDCIKHIESNEYDQAVTVYKAMCKKMQQL